MKQISRRSILAGSAAAVAAPILSSRSEAADVDVAIVGAGAAGIAAARRLIAAGRRVVVLEAGDRIGGRCVTDTRLFGVPYDLGAHWLHMPDFNPVAKLAGRTGLEVYPAPPGQKLRIGLRNARESEMETFLAHLVRCNRAIAEAARGRMDVSCKQALPQDLGDWGPTLEFVLGPFGCAKDLGEISAVDFSRSLERDIDAFCRQGLGTLLAKLADGLPIELANPVRAIDTRGTLDVETAKGRVGARAVIVTASTNVLLSGKIRFTPDLPKRQTDAMDSLKLGTYERVALELKDNPLGLQRDDLVFEKSESARTAALLANVSGTPLAFVDIGGNFGRDVSAQGPDAMTAFVQDWLAGLFGNDLRKNVGRVHATQWNAAPWVMGAFSAAAVSGQPARRVLMEPVRERVFFAGEAVHETLWGTVGGAFESGERAAEAVLRKMGWLKDAEPSQRTPTRRR